MQANRSELECPNCGSTMLKALGVARSANEMEQFFGIAESCTQWECPRCFHKLFIGTSTGNTYPWRDPLGWERGSR